VRPRNSLGPNSDCAGTSEQEQIADVPAPGRSAIAINTLAAARVHQRVQGSSTAWRPARRRPDSAFHGMRLKNGWKASALPGPTTSTQERWSCLRGREGRATPTTPTT